MKWNVESRSQIALQPTVSKEIEFSPRASGDDPPTVSPQGVKRKDDSETMSFNRIALHHPQAVAEGLPNIDSVLMTDHPSKRCRLAEVYKNGSLTTKNAGVGPEPVKVGAAARASQNINTVAEFAQFCHHHLS
ncbi:MAG: hypothetical protein AB7S38_26330 [Vulcanimicrobiota bacterium]